MNHTIKRLFALCLALNFVAVAPALAEGPPTKQPPTKCPPVKCRPSKGKRPKKERCHPPRKKQDCIVGVWKYSVALGIIDNTNNSEATSNEIFIVNGEQTVHNDGTALVDGAFEFNGIPDPLTEEMLSSLNILSPGIRLQGVWKKIGRCTYKFVATTTLQKRIIGSEGTLSSGNERIRVEYIIVLGKGGNSFEVTGRALFPDKVKTPDLEAENGPNSANGIIFLGEGKRLRVKKRKKIIT